MLKNIKLIITEEGVWLEDNLDDVHIRIAHNITPGLVVGHNVCGGLQDGGSKYALIFEKNNIYIQVIEEFTKKVNIYHIDNQKVYDAILEMLKTLAGNEQPSHDSFT